MATTQFSRSASAGSGKTRPLAALCPKAPRSANLIVQGQRAPSPLLTSARSLLIPRPASPLRKAVATVCEKEVRRARSSEATSYEEWPRHRVKEGYENTLYPDQRLQALHQRPPRTQARQLNGGPCISLPAHDPGHCPPSRPFSLSGELLHQASYPVCYAQNANSASARDVVSNPAMEGEGKGRQGRGGQEREGKEKARAKAQATVPKKAEERQLRSNGEARANGRRPPQPPSPPVAIRGATQWHPPGFLHESSGTFEDASVPIFSACQVSVASRLHMQAHNIPKARHLRRM
eukprot:s681_g15.t1